MASKSPSHTIDVIIAEFQALRSEIESALSTQQTIVGLNITAIGVVSGLVLTHKVNPLLLLVVAAFSSGLGLYIEGGWHHIRRVLRYIDGPLRQLAVEYTGDDRVLAWETWSLTNPGAWKRIIPVGLAIVIIFSAMPFVMLVWTFPHIKGLGPWLAWVGTATVFILQLSAGATLAWDILRRKL